MAPPTTSECDSGVVPVLGLCQRVCDSSPEGSEFQPLSITGSRTSGVAAVVCATCEHARPGEGVATTSQTFAIAACIVQLA
mmetsp:Transcript_142349/g.251242  ORF Transcript_142349/g.251242 Transcript_142349/m.251242 type:complete len:81 (-) Transcript_142349:585-827(-)